MLYLNSDEYVLHFKLREENIIKLFDLILLIYSALFLTSFLPICQKYMRENLSTMFFHNWAISPLYHGMFFFFFRALIRTLVTIIYVVNCISPLLKTLTALWKKLDHVSILRHWYLLQKKRTAKSVFLFQ